MPLAKQKQPIIFVLLIHFGQVLLLIKIPNPYNQQKSVIPNEWGILSYVELWLTFN